MRDKANLKRWQTENRIKNRDKINARKRATYARNKARIKAQQREYYLKNKTEIIRKTTARARRVRAIRNADPATIATKRERKVAMSAKRSVWMRDMQRKKYGGRILRSKDPEVIKAYNAKYHSRPEVKAARRAYHDAYIQRPEARAKRALRDRLRCAPGTNESIARALRSRLRCALFAQGVRKTRATMGLIGLSLVEFRAYFESHFLPGMTWENHGDWHIDHKKPCSKFDLSDPDQQRLCFHYTNLQPLWKIDNLRKGAKTYE